MTYGRNLPIVAGAYVIGGNVLTSSRGYAVSIATGAYTIAGNNIVLIAGAGAAKKQNRMAGIKVPSPGIFGKNI